MSKTPIAGYNLISAAICILVGAIPVVIAAMRTNSLVWSLLGGIMIGLSLGALYLGVQWKKKTTVHYTIALVASAVSTLGITLILTAL